MQIYTETLRRLDWLSPLLIAVVLLAATHPHAALAAAAGGGSLPWDAPLTTLKNDITGPVAFTISLLAMVACGAALVFGGEIHEFVSPHHHAGPRGVVYRRGHKPGKRTGHCRGGRMSLRRLPFHRVLHRPALFLGGERELALMTLIIAGGLAVSGMNLVSCAVGGMVWFCSIPVFRWMAKSDPQMSKVYIRQLKYRGYYPARSRPYRTE
jgi:type IV secretory pathway TrbD component/type IV secretory pathway VirB2 component (pilin)